MDAFEQIVSQLLLEDGYWSIIGYKVDISQKQANELKNSSMPRPEIDIVAYKAVSKTLYLLEVKSYIDSVGVSIKSLSNLKTNKKGRYKILTWEKYRNLIKKIILNDLFKKGMLADRKIKIEFGLVAGNFYKNITETDVKEHFKSKGFGNWLVWGPETITRKISDLASKGYENNAVTIAAKLMRPDIKKSGQKLRKEKRKKG